MWFEDLVGFKETNPQGVREKLQFKNGVLKSLVNSRCFKTGSLTTPSLKDMRQHLLSIEGSKGYLTISEVIGDVMKIHSDPENNRAVFQAASQFNLLEMISPDVTPEEGVGIYQFDRTQGPACAISCGAGTIYRNYFVPLNGGIGQTATNQIDCLKNIGNLLNNDNNRLWKVVNGYMFPSEDGLKLINEKLSELSDNEKDDLFSNLRIGIQWDAEVTINGCNNVVTQAYCSAVPIGYTSFYILDWEPFARQILKASYEMTFITAIINRSKGNSNRLYLTQIGGGVFGNRSEWIMDAIKSSLIKFKSFDLDIRIVSYSKRSPAVQQLIKDFSQFRNE